MKPVRTANPTAGGFRRHPSNETPTTMTEKHMTGHDLRSIDDAATPLIERRQVPGAYGRSPDFFARYFYHALPRWFHATQHVAGFLEQYERTRARG